MMDLFSVHATGVVVQVQKRDVNGSHLLHVRVKSTYGSLFRIWHLSFWGNNAVQQTNIAVGDVVCFTGLVKMTSYKRPDGTWAEVYDIESPRMITIGMLDGVVPKTTTAKATTQSKPEKVAPVVQKVYNYDFSTKEDDDYYYQPYADDLHS